MMMILKVFGMSCPTTNNNSSDIDMGRDIVEEEVGGKTSSSRGDLSDLDSTFFDLLPLLQRKRMLLNHKLQSIKGGRGTLNNNKEEEYNITLTLFLYGLMDRYLRVAHSKILLFFPQHLPLPLLLLLLVQLQLQSCSSHPLQRTNKLVSGQMYVLS